MKLLAEPPELDSSVLVSFKPTGITCECCYINEGDFTTPDPAVMITHLQQHQKKGDHVPPDILAECWEHERRIRRLSC